MAEQDEETEEIEEIEEIDETDETAEQVKQAGPAAPAGPGIIIRRQIRHRIPEKTGKGDCRYLRKHSRAAATQRPATETCRRTAPAS